MFTRGATVTLFLLALATSLLLAEVTVRQLLPAPSVVSFPEAEVDGIFEPHPVRGWAYRPGVYRDVITPDYTIEFRANELGFRDDPFEVAPDKFRILALGDSYTQGHGVELEETWVKQLQGRLPDTRVYNTGVSGYGLHQFRVTAEELMPVLRPHLIIVGLYSSGYRRVTTPYVLVGGDRGLILESVGDDIIVHDGEILARRYGNELAHRLDLWLNRRWQFGAHLLALVGRAWGAVKASMPERGEAGRGQTLREAMAPALNELLAIQELADEHGIPMLTLLINPQAPDGSYSPSEWSYNGVILRFAEEHDLEVVNPLPHLAESARGEPRFRLGDDPHWAPSAHALAAELLLGPVLSVAPQTLP